MLSFMVLSGSIVAIWRKAIALNISNILNWTTFLTFFRQHTHKIYRGHNIHVIVARFDIKLVGSIVRFFVYAPLTKIHAFSKRVESVEKFSRWLIIN